MDGTAFWVAAVIASIAVGPVQGRFARGRDDVGADSVAGHATVAGGGVVAADLYRVGLVRGLGLSPRI